MAVIHSSGYESLSKAQALALFERIYAALSALAHPYELKLYCEKERGILVQEEWTIIINDEVIECEEHWESYKSEHAILETDADLNAYADAMRAQAEQEGQP